MQHETNTEQPGWSFLKSPRWLGYYTLIIVFSIACVFLGNWQFDRRAQAQAEILRLDTNYEAAAVPVAEALPTLQSFEIDANKWQKVALTGTYFGEPYLARNRVSSQGVGATLIHPLLLNTGEIFFVDRGWVPVNAAEGVPDVLPLPAKGEVEVVVRLRESEVEIKNRQNQGRTLGSINLPLLAQNFSKPAYTGAYGQVVSETPAGEVGLLPPKPERDEGPHLSYALQWYVFIFIVAGGAWYAATLEYRSLNGKTAKEPRKKRRPSDAEEEDALLDG